MLPTIISHRYGQRGAEEVPAEMTSMKKELLTVNALAAGLRLRPKSIRQALSNGRISVLWSLGSLVVAHGYI